MAKIIIKWKSSLFGAACKFDVYLMNAHIGELKCGGALEASVGVGTHTLFFKEKRKFGKKADTSFEVVVNEETEIIELRTKFDMNGSFAVRYADNAPHVPTYNSGVTQPNVEHQTNIINQEIKKDSRRPKKNRGCLSGCLTTIIIIMAISIIVTVIVGNNDNSEHKISNQTEEVEQTETALYSDDNFKITFVDFKDPKLGVTSYNLLLKIENNSNKTVVVVPSDGYANDEAVFLGSGMPVKVKPGKKTTGAFAVGYGNTSIKNIDEVKSLELKITLYDENYSETILTTGDMLINFR